MRDNPLLQAIVVFSLVGVGAVAWGIADFVLGSSAKDDVDGVLLLIGGLGCGWFVWRGLKRRASERHALTRGQPPV